MFNAVCKYNIACLLLLTHQFNYSMNDIGLFKISSYRLGFISALTAILLCSCVSLKTPKRQDLVPLTAPIVIGDYPLRFDRPMSRVVNMQLKEDTIISMVLWNFFRDFPVKDSLEFAHATHIHLELRDKSHLLASLHDGLTPLRTEIIEGRLRKGYFRIKHELSFRGVPPFYWSMSSSKMQFGLSNHGQLYIDQADETNGSILIIMAGVGGFTTSYTVPKLSR